MAKAALREQAAFVFLVRGYHLAEEIIYLNTFGQLFEGVDAEGEELEKHGGFYAVSTIKEKKRLGLPWSRVTLFHTGVFYRTFEVEMGSDGFRIMADTFKDGEDLQIRWGDNLVGLDDESRAELKAAVLPGLRDYVLQTLLR